VSTLSRPPCAAGGIWVNSIEGPELALYDWQLFSAMQKTISSDRCKKTGTNSRSCMCPHNRLPDARGERRPAECLDRNLTALSPGVHLQRGPTTGMIILVADDNALSRELIREPLEGSGQVAEKFGLQQIFWYRTTLTDLTRSALQLLE
jgi:hypothetical protein